MEHVAYLPIYPSESAPVCSGDRRGWHSPLGEVVNFSKVSLFLLEKSDSCE